MKTASRYILAIFFSFAGINHFRIPEFYLSMMPAYLPYHLELVYLSGIAEVVLGLTALRSAYDAFTRRALILLLLAVFPANIEMALHVDKFPSLSAALLYLRLPFQLILMLWVWKTLPPK